MNKLVLKSVSIEIEAISEDHPPLDIGKPQKASIQFAGETYEINVIFTHCQSSKTRGERFCEVVLRAEGHSKLEVES